MDKLTFVAEFLLKNESMDDEQFKAAMEMDNPTFEAIEAIVKEKIRTSEEENKVAHENNAKAEEEELKRTAESEKPEDTDLLTSFFNDMNSGNLVDRSNEKDSEPKNEENQNNTDDSSDLDSSNSTDDNN